MLKIYALATFCTTIAAVIALAVIQSEIGLQITLPAFDWREIFRFVRYAVYVTVFCGMVLFFAK